MQNASPCDATLPFLTAGRLAAGARGFTDDETAVIDIPELVVAPAVTYSQLRACSNLVRRMYAWRGYRLAPNRLLPDDPNHVTIGAWLNSPRRRLVICAEAS